MEKVFKDVLSIEGVKGVVFLSPKGRIVFKDFKDQPVHGLERMDILSPIKSLKGVKEADLIFSNCRIYLRKAPEGYIMVVLGRFVAMAMVRLQCDLLLPNLKPKRPVRGLMRLFRL